MDRFVNVFGLIIGLATVTTVVSRETSASVIRAVGDAFTGALRAAMRE